MKLNGLLHNLTPMFDLIRASLGGSSVSIGMPIAHQLSSMAIIAGDTLPDATKTLQGHIQKYAIDRTYSLT